MSADTNPGRVVAVRGAFVDVRFEGGPVLPIHTTLKVPWDICTTQRRARQNEVAAEIIGLAAGEPASAR